MKKPIEEPRRGAPAGNQNAAKDDGFDAVLNIKCFQSEKGSWKRKAGDQKLSEWVRETLNRAR